MVEENLHLSSDNIEYCVVTLLEKIDALRNETSRKTNDFWKFPTRAEIRTLVFWRSVICECIASFCYVFIVCGAAAGVGTEASNASALFAAAFATGLSITTLTQCFGHISGAHINPAVTIAMAITNNVSIIRTIMYVIAQCGGGIAGAACLYGITSPGCQTGWSVTVMNNPNIVAWERFGVEVVLSFIVVLTYLVTMNTYNKWLSSSSLTIGSAYASCTLVSMPHLNPALSLGPSFVLSKWDNHWVYWVGPLTGGVISGFVYEYVLNTRRRKSKTESNDGDSLSIQSDEDPYDDLERPAASKYNDPSYNYRPSGTAVVTASSGYCPSVMSSSLYSAPLCKLERVESLYGGTKSLYCKSPPLSRANLNRSQSVYTKSNNGASRDALPRPGPLVPAQSLYPIRLNQQQNHTQNQNVQNQMQQRSESSFGVRGHTAVGAASRVDGYGVVPSNTSPRKNSPENDNMKYEDTQKFVRSNRPESMYGLTTNSSHHPQSDDSNYSSYYGSSKRSNPNGSVAYHNTGTSSLTAKTKTTTKPYGPRSSDLVHPPSQLVTTVPSPSSFHHVIPQHSAALQY